MPQLTNNRAKERVNDFSWGQNSGAVPSNLLPGQAELLENCIISRKGRCEQRTGLTLLGTDNSTTNVILGLFHYNAGTTLDTLIRVRATKVQRLAADFSDWTDITGLTTLTTGLTTNFVQALDRLFILNGTDNVFSIDTSFTVTDEGDTNADPPKTTFGEWATNNKLFLSGSLTDSERDYVWFSDTLAPQTFVRDTNVFKCRSGGGGKVTWLKMFKEDELIVYKNDSIFVLNITGATPLTDWELTPLSTAVGCPAGRTVQDIGNDHIFLSNDGVRLLSRTNFDKIRSGLISEPIQDIIDDINQDAIETSCGWFENGLYILGVPVGTSTVPNRFVIWDSVAAKRNGDPNSAWTTIPEDQWNMSCFSSFGFGDNVKTIVGGASLANSICYKVLNGVTDNGTAFYQRIITRQHDFGDPFIDKIFDPAQCVAETGSDAVYVISVDVDRSGFTQCGTMTLTGSLQTPFTTPATTGGNEILHSNFRTKFIGRGNSVRFQILNTTASETPIFYEYTVHARPYSGRM